MVARRAHNPKVVGSNPASATTNQSLRLVFLCLNLIVLYNGVWYHRAWLVGLARLKQSVDFFAINPYCGLYIFKVKTL